jgi:N-carbamoylputrescine amidase
MAPDAYMVAAAQMEPRIGEPESNIARSVALLERAAHAGARLIVLPELANSGYIFESLDEALRLSETIPDGLACQAWEAAARRLGIFVAAGLTEREGDTLFNAAVLIGPDGHVGAYRKLHLWDRENLFFRPGNLGLPVFETELGRIGMAICYDGWFPETFRTLALRGADLVCVPTNWVPIPGQRAGEVAMATVLIQAAAHSNGVAIACADRIGVERGQRFEGQSVIVGHAGWPLAGPASRDGEEILAATIDVAAIRNSRTWNGFNGVLKDRRTDVYGDVLETAEQPVRT